MRDCKHCKIQYAIAKGTTLRLMKINKKSKICS